MDAIAKAKTMTNHKECQATASPMPSQREAIANSTKLPHPTIKECKATAFFFFLLLSFEKENVGERMMNVLSKRKENRASGVFFGKVKL